MIFFKGSLVKIIDDFIDKKFANKDDPKVISIKEGLKSITKMEDMQLDLWDDELFRFIITVTGIISSKWTLLRQVAQQRLASSPYSAQLEKLDLLIGAYYSKLRNAFPDEIQKSISEIQPIAYFGHLPQLNLFNYGAPGIISIPWGAMYEGEDSVSQLAIPHEIAHSIFEQLPEFLPELKSKIKGMADRNRQSEMLYKLISDWANEIAADMIGTALAGPKFVESAIRLATVSNSLAEMATAIEHPPILLRPRVHLEAFKHVNKLPDGSVNEAAVKPLEEQYNIIADGQCDKLFTGLRGLTVINCAEVGKALVKVVNKILEPKLESLGNISLGDLLLNCVKESRRELPRIMLTSSGYKRLRKWRTVELLRSDAPVVLDLPNTPDLDYAMPIVSINEGCCYLPFIRCACPECNQCP